MAATRVRVAISGDIDAANGQALGRFVERHARASTQLILDLSRVDFFGSRGFTALHYLSVQCARRDVDWAIIDNRVVQRILRICDIQADLPVVGNLDAALRRLDRLARYHHRVSRAG